MLPDVSEPHIRQSTHAALSPPSAHVSSVAAAAALQGKFGGLFASLPNAMVSGLFCVMFGCICAGGPTATSLRMLTCSPFAQTAAAAPCLPASLPWLYCFTYVSAFLVSLSCQPSLPQLKTSIVFATYVMSALSFPSCCPVRCCATRAVGLAQMQFADQRSNRNIFILGFRWVLHHRLVQESTNVLV